MQQSADFFCKETSPERPRLEAPFPLFVVQQQRHDVENVASACAIPAASTNFMELKPQQTGTGLLIRYREVATTSGSTNSLPRGVTAACRVLTPTVLVRIQARQPITAR